MKEIQFDDDRFTFAPNANDAYKTKSDFSSKSVFRPPESLKDIYTDGGARIIQTEERKRYVGAWAFYDEFSNELVGAAQDDSTNNSMELTAVIKALEYLDSLGIPKDKWCTIILDSDYVRFGAISWCKKWERNGWKKYDSSGNETEIKNLELWKQLRELTRDRKIWFKKVAGHSGIEGNEKVDIECTRLMDEFCKENNIVKKK